MTDVFGLGIQPHCSEGDGNLPIDEGVQPLTETQSIKIGDIIAAMPTDEETGIQNFTYVLPQLGYREEQLSNFGQASSNLMNFSWSETRTGEDSVSTETTTSLQEEMLNNMGQFLEPSTAVSGIGPENEIELTVNAWPDVRDFQNPIAEGASFRNINDGQVHGECRQFNEMSNYDDVPVMPSCSTSQPYSSISVIQNVREVAELPKLEKIECIESGGPVFSQPQSVNEMTKQEEKKQKRRERNRLCSKQFRQKQKAKEHILTEGLRTKTAKLKDLHLKLEAASKMLFRIVSSSAACNKGRSMVNAVAGLVNQENWPGGLQIAFANTNQAK